MSNFFMVLRLNIKSNLQEVFAYSIKEKEKLINRSVLKYIAQYMVLSGKLLNIMSNYYMGLPSNECKIDKCDVNFFKCFLHSMEIKIDKYDANSF